MTYKRLVVTTSWDDTRAGWRLSNLLESYGLKATFYVVSNWIGKTISIDELRSMSEVFELGAHTKSHVILTKVSNEVAKREISGSKIDLEKKITHVTSFAYPHGLYRKEHVAMVREAGFLCARTTKPFSVDACNPFEINVTLQAAPHRLIDAKGLARCFRITPKIFLRLDLFKKWDLLGKILFDSLLRTGGVFHLWGHEWEIEQYKSWSRLEDLLAHIAFRRNVTYLTVTDCATMLCNNRKNAKFC
ncbi:MAG: polysaccharide deacetylase family protein [Candidatus Bathyarchaeota archaeon]|nr:polysaccharide deacetylase family protein [Candidatus Bathyarchaeota archaeon]